MLLPTILDVPRGQASSDAQPCPSCDAPLKVLQSVAHVARDGPRAVHDDEDDCDRICHRAFIHGEVSLICFPVTRPGGAFGIMAGDWEAIRDALETLHER